MKERFRYFISLSVLSFIPYSLFSQPIFKDSTDAYNYWAQRGITEMIYSSMLDNPKSLNDEEKAGKKLYFEKYINGIDKKVFSDIEQAFNESEQFLNNNAYKNTAKNFFLPLKKAFEQRKPFNDQFFTVPHNYENPQNWDKKKAELLDSYRKSLQNKARVVRPAEKIVLVPEAGAEMPTEKAIISGWLWILTGLLMGFFGGALLIYMYSRSRIYSILKTEQRKYLNDLKKDNGQKLLHQKYFKYIGLVTLLKSSKDEKAKTNEEKNRKILDLESQNEKLRTETEQKDKIIADLKIAAEYKASVGVNSQRQPGKSSGITGNNMEIFFTIPESDGSFKNANAKDDHDNDCFYKIVPDKTGQKGKLYFISGDYDLRALDNIDYYLNPVCEIQNISDRTFARKILMTDPGFVTKRGEYWKIENNNKVKVKLV